MGFCLNCKRKAGEKLDGDVEVQGEREDRLSGKGQEQWTCKGQNHIIKLEDGIGRRRMRRAEEERR